MRQDVTAMDRDDLDALRDRSAALAGETGEDALEVNRAILALAPADPVASNRLGIALINLHRYEEAVEVLAPAVDAHPDNPIAVKRLEEARRRQRAGPPPAPSPGNGGVRPPRSDGPTYWIKAIHYHDDDWTIEPGEQTWISDIGRRDARGRRVYREDGVPWGEPSWRVGEEIGLYFGGTLKVPVLVEVVAPPEFNPGLVQAEAHGGEPDAGERWPWVTRVKGLYAVPLDEAPDLDRLDIPHERVQRRARFTITPDQHARLVEALR
jgi:hypothetical protein